MVVVAMASSTNDARSPTLGTGGTTSPSPSYTSRVGIIAQAPEDASIPPSAADDGIPRSRVRLIFAFMLVMQFMLSIDTTSIAVALPAIAQDLETDEFGIFNMATAFFMGATLFQQPVAELSHAVGRKPAFMLVLFVFFVGSITAATGRNMAALLVGRGMQGFASGGSVLTALVLTDLVELRDRPTWLAYSNAVQAVGMVLGPLIGAGLIKVSSWHWLFWINLPPIFASAVGLGLLLGFDKPAEGYLRSLKRVDWAGMAIFCLSAGLILVPCTMANVYLRWDSPAALSCLVCGIVGLLFLAFHQRQLARNPMFRPSIFTRYTTVAGYLGQAVFGVCVNLILYYLVMFWVGVRGQGELMTGVALLPETVCIPLAAIGVGWGIRRSGRIGWAMYAGWPTLVLATGLLWFSDAEDTPLAALVLINVLVGLGAGTTISALNMAILATTRRRDNGHAIAMAWLFKSAGMCLGMAIGTAIFKREFGLRVGRAGDIEIGPEMLMQRLRQVKTTDPDVQEILVSSLRLIWMTCCALTGVVGAMCCFARYPTLEERDRWEESEQAKEGAEEARCRQQQEQQQQQQQHEPKPVPPPPPSPSP